MPVWKNINKIKLLKRVLLFTLLIGGIGVFFANRFVKGKGFDNIIDFTSNYYDNKKLVSDNPPSEMVILMDDKDYQYIEQKREEALSRGIQINEGDTYVPCKVVSEGDTIKGEIRLKGHMTDHLEGEKWSFRVKTKDDVLGMYRFSLQHPGTRNYVYEWIYHEMLKNENIIALKYDYLNLKLNDKDLGIYAIEEHFGQHILQANDRPKGAILRWNPELYWDSRISELQGLYVETEYGHYQNSFPEPYDKGNVRDDSALIENYQIGANLLNEFRKGQKTTSEVFDVDRMATFHAIIDLIGGYHSLDWSDVKYYYNSESKLIEPVGYESFSVREVFSLAGQRIPNKYVGLEDDFHDLLFSDSVFFRAYIGELERICNEAYLKSFFDKIDDDLRAKRGVLAHEFAYIKFSTDLYFKNVRTINEILSLPKPLHAFKDEGNDSLVKISMSATSDFPLEVIGMEVDSKDDYMFDSPICISPKSKRTVSDFQQFTFEHQSKKLKNIFLKVKILGGSEVFNVEVLDLPSYQKVEIDCTEAVLSLSNFDGVIEISNNQFIFKDDEVNLEQPLHISEGEELLVNSNQSLNFSKNAQLIIKGVFKIQGNSDRSVKVNSSSSKAALVFSEGKGEFNYCHFSSSLKSQFFNLKNSQLRMNNCIAYEIDNALITGVNSNVYLTNFNAGSLYQLGEIDRCELMMKNCHFNKGDLLVDASGSIIDIEACSFKNYEQIANLDYDSQFNVWISHFKNNNLLCQLQNFSTATLQGCKTLEGEIGFKLDSMATHYNRPTYVLYDTESTGLKKIEERNI
jgi:CotH kinase protein